MIGAAVVTYWPHLHLPVACKERRVHQVAECRHKVAVKFQREPAPTKPTQPCWLHAASCPLEDHSNGNRCNRRRDSLVVADGFVVIVHRSIRVAELAVRIRHRRVQPTIDQPNCTARHGSVSAYLLRPIRVGTTLWTRPSTESVPLRPARCLSAPLSESAASRLPRCRKPAQCPSHCGKPAQVELSDGTVGCARQVAVCPQWCDRVSDRRYYNSAAQGGTGPAGGTYRSASFVRRST